MIATHKTICAFMKDSKQSWELLNLKTKEFTIYFAISQKKQKNIDLNKFKSNIEYLEALITIGKLTEEDKKLLLSKNII